MEITLRYVRMLDISDVDYDSTMEIPAGATVTDVLDELEIDEDKQQFIQPEINGEEERLETTLSDGDELFLFLPIQGEH